MEVTVKARNMTLTEALRAYVDDKLVGPLRHLVDSPAAHIEVELCNWTRNEGHKECRVHVTLPAVEPVIIHEASDDMYRAINLAEARMLVQVKRHRDRARDGQHRGKQAAQERHGTARQVLTQQPEAWEREVAAYEQATPPQL
jgi:ribosomal subunit interface protein